MRVLALDHGSARCGCALSDPTGSLATPLGVVEQPDTRRGLARVIALVREREVATIVVGLPLSLGGGDTAQTAQARAFAHRLARALPGIPVELHDERLTTRLAQRHGGRGDEDARAAAHLLESWLASRSQDPPVEARIG